MIKIDIKVREDGKTLEQSKFYLTAYLAEDMLEARETAKRIANEAKRQSHH